MVFLINESRLKEKKKCSKNLNGQIKILTEEQLKLERLILNWNCVTFSDGRGTGAEVLVSFYFSLQRK